MPRLTESVRSVWFRSPVMILVRNIGPPVLG